MSAKSLRQKVALWLFAAVVVTSLVGFALPTAPVFAGGICVQTPCSGG